MDIEDDILIQKYETLLHNKESIYFDSDEFGIIITHYMSEERYADALEALVHAELCHPEDNELTLHKVRVMMHLDNFDRAFDLLLILEQKAYNSFEVNLYKGNIYVLNEDIGNAIMEFELAFEKSSRYDIDELINIPYILMDNRYYREALTYLHKFIKEGEADAEILFSTGFCYEKIGNVKKAEKYYEKSLDEDPFNEKTWIMLGALYLSTMHIDKALEAFKYAHSVNNNEYIAMLCKAATLIQADEYESAVKCIMELLTKMPDDVSAIESVDVPYEVMPDLYDIGLSNIDVTNLDPQLEIPFWSLSKLMYVDGDFEDAIQVIDKVIAINPNNEEYFYFRGQCFIGLSENREKLEKILHNPFIIKELRGRNFKDSEFKNKHKKAVFSYEVEDKEKCCKYLIDAMLINCEALEIFFSIFPEARDDAYIITYLGKHLK
ncbi:MAG: tetratricopeptide repeat protein [Prevotellaceae bacterium]|jgi:tetratricopeptide (TPR) repeat protein|nr:tetratricopeptide repeat protein [Prevotellaceae bacterium]